MGSRPSLLFCLVPCSRLSWLFVSCLAHVNILYCIVSNRMSTAPSHLVVFATMQSGRNFSFCLNFIFYIIYWWIKIIHDDCDYFNSLPGGVRSNAMSVYVCLSARTSKKPHVQTSRNFLYILPVVVTRSSSDDNAICCVLPVLWMTSHLPIMGHREIG